MKYLKKMSDNLISDKPCATEAYYNQIRRQESEDYYAENICHQAEYESRFKLVENSYEQAIDSESSVQSQFDPINRLLVGGSTSIDMEIVETTDSYVKSRAIGLESMMVETQVETAAEQDADTPTEEHLQDLDQFMRMVYGLIDYKDDVAKRVCEHELSRRFLVVQSKKWKPALWNKPNHDDFKKFFLGDWFPGRTKVQFMKIAFSALISMIEEDNKPTTRTNTKQALDKIVEQYATEENVDRIKKLFRYANKHFNTISQKKAENVRSDQKTLTMEDQDEDDDSVRTDSDTENKPKAKARGMDDGECLAVLMSEKLFAFVVDLETLFRLADNLIGLSMQNINNLSSMLEVYGFIKTLAYLTGRSKLGDGAEENLKPNLQADKLPSSANGDMMAITEAFKNITLKKLRHIKLPVHIESIIEAIIEMLERLKRVADDARKPAKVSCKRRKKAKKPMSEEVKILMDARSKVLETLIKTIESNKKEMIDVLVGIPEEELEQPIKEAEEILRMIREIPRKTELSLEQQKKEVDKILRMIKCLPGMAEEDLEQPKRILIIKMNRKINETEMDAELMEKEIDLKKLEAVVRTQLEVLKKKNKQVEELKNKKKKQVQKLKKKKQVQELKKKQQVQVQELKKNKKNQVEVLKKKKQVQEPKKKKQVPKKKKQVQVLKKKQVQVPKKKKQVQVQDLKKKKQVQVQDLKKKKQVQVQDLKKKRQVQKLETETE